LWPAWCGRPAWLGCARRRRGGRPGGLIFEILSDEPFPSPFLFSPRAGRGRGARRAVGRCPPSHTKASSFSAWYTGLVVLRPSVFFDALG